MSSIRTAIPCKKPRVEISYTTKTGANGDPFTVHRVTCKVTGCDWVYDAAVATDAADQAKWHRGHHRNLVPWTDISLDGAHGYTGHCGCGWTTGRGVTTRTDVEASLANHLSRDHGLVTA